MALANNILFFSMFALMLIGVLVLVIKGLASSSPKSNKIVDKDKGALAESEEQMMPGEENKEGIMNIHNHDLGMKKTVGDINEEHKDGDTDDKNKDENKEEDDLDLEEEEIY